MDKEMLKGLGISELTELEKAYLKDVEPSTLERLKKRGYEITSITDGFQVWIKKIGIDEDEEYNGFGECIEEAIDLALPIE